MGSILDDVVYAAHFACIVHSEITRAWWVHCVFKSHQPRCKSMLTDCAYTSLHTDVSVISMNLRWRTYELEVTTAEVDDLGAARNRRPQSLELV